MRGMVIDPDNGLKLYVGKSRLHKLASFSSNLRVVPVIVFLQLNLSPEFPNPA